MANRNGSSTAKVSSWLRGRSRYSQTACADSGVNSDSSAVRARLAQCIASTGSTSGTAGAAWTVNRTAQSVPHRRILHRGFVSTMHGFPLERFGLAVLQVR